jgi:hypothetical protein
VFACARAAVSKRGSLHPVEDFAEGVGLLVPTAAGGRAAPMPDERRAHNYCDVAREQHRPDICAFEQ